MLSAHPVWKVFLSGLTITNGQATSAQQDGGGIFNYGTLTVSNCVISGNKTAPCNVITCFSGGGIANLSVCTIINSTISQNEASGNGGGIFTSAAGLSLVNCTICSNIADADYGAIFGFPVFMTNCTVAENQAAVSVGGVVSSTSSSNVLANSIIAGNTAGGFPSDVSGPFISAGYNFIGVTNGSTGFGLSGSQDQVGSVASPIDPSLGPLQINGGQTPTLAPLPGSPVIDQGKSFGIATDQRGRSRPYVNPYSTEPPGGDGSDIGAYEVNPASLVVSNNNDSGPGSLRQTLQDAGGSDYDTISFAPGVTGVITLTNGPIVVDKTLSITGPGATILTLSGNNNSRIFSITGKNTQLVLDGLSLVQAQSADGCLLVSTNAALNVEFCTVRGNACAGIYNQGQVELIYSTVAGNANPGPGGAIANQGGNLTVVDSTLSGNSASLGGGIYFNHGSLFLYSSTIVSNSTIAVGVPSQQGGGIDIFGPALPPVVQSTIIANNSANQGPDVLGTFNSAGYNLIGIGDGSAGFTNGMSQDQVGSAGTPLDPLLGPLQNNGGPTPTHAPLSGSPVVDQGYDVLGLTIDQRGLPRTVDIACATNAIGGDGTDIGAVEADSSYICPCNCSTQVVVDVSQTLRSVDARSSGVNSAIWEYGFDSPDTLSLLTEMGCRTLRFPGGSFSDEYHWASNYIEGSSFEAWPTAFTNFMDIATNLGANVFITVNYGTGTTNEAADWVNFANNLNQCGFKYWEVGNECYGTWEADHNTNAPYLPNDPWTYAMRFRDYYNAMKAVDPTIKVGIVAVPGEDTYVNNLSHSAYNPRTGTTHYGWTPVLLSTLAGLGVTPDFMVHHFYPEYQVDSDSRLLQAATNWAGDAANLRQQISDYFGPGGTNIELLCTENNADSGSQGRQSTSLVNGLYIADSLSQIMKTEFDSWLWWIFENGQDTSGDFDPALYGWRTYGDFGLVLNASTRYPTFYAMKLMQYYARPGDTILNATSGDPLLAVYAAKKSGGALSLLVINKDPTNTLTRQITLAGFMPNAVATVRFYGIPQDDAARTNAPSAAQDIATGTFGGAAPSFSYSFPPYSLTLFTFAPPGAPLLSISLTPTNTAVISWPDIGAYTLQTNGNLSTTNWADYGGVVTTTNNTNSVTITPPTGDLFFRLSQ